MVTYVLDALDRGDYFVLLNSLLLLICFCYICLNVLAISLVRPNLPADFR